MNRRRVDRCVGGITGMVALVLAALGIGLMLLLGAVAVPHLLEVIGQPAAGGGSDLAMLQRDRLLPLLLGTAARTVLMSLVLVPAGVLTAVYLTEYAQPEAWAPRVLRAGIHALAAVPGVVFGMVGLGFLVGVVGGALDRFAGDPQAGGWGRPALVWASVTLAWMSLPVVVETSEEALRSVPRTLRSAAVALGATRWQVLLRVLLPNALPGMAAGVLRALGKAAGEVAPLLFTGAVIAPSAVTALNSPFPDLAFEVFMRSMAASEAGVGRPFLRVALWVLVFGALMLNAAAALLRRSPVSKGQGAPMTW